MNRRLLALVILLAAAAIRPASAQTSVLFNFESGSVAGWEHWSYGSAVDIESGLVHSGSYGLRYTHTEGETRYATAWDEPPVGNWTNFNRIRYWARSDVNTGQNTVKIKFFENGGEAWIQKRGTLLTTSFQEVVAALNRTDTNGFELAEGGVNWILELNNITNVVLVFDAQTAHMPYVVYYYVDDIDLVRHQAAELSLSTNVLDFGGALHPSPGDRRYASAPVYVNYSVAGYDSWSIIAYSTHPAHRAGMVGLVETNYDLPLKCWAGEAIENVPDPELMSNWTSTWAYVTDEAESWHPTLASPAVNPLASGFKALFATDASGVYTQAYSASVTIELAVE